MIFFLRYLVVLAALAFGGIPALAQSPTLIPQATLQTNINAGVIDNTGGLITPSIVRQILLDMSVPEYVTFTDGTNSVSPVTTATFVGATVTGTLPFATITINPQPLTIGTTVVSGGTNAYVLTDNAGILGNVPLPPTGITVTDGANSVANTTSLTFANGLTISGSTPNATATPQWATNSNIWSGTSHKFIDPAGANGAIAPVTVNESGGTFSINFGAAINLELPLVHADCPCTIANPTNVYAGLSGNITLLQSATGSDTIGSWGSTWKFPGGTAPALSSAANAIDVLPFYCRSTTFCVVTIVGNVH